MNPEISYATWHELAGDPTRKFVSDVLDACEPEGVRTVCDIGGGANPLLGLADTQPRGIERYVVTDISSEELAKCPPGYEKLTADAATVPPGYEGSFDLAFSHTVAEHVPNPEAFHRAVFALLRPGGRAMHFFPTLYEPAFVINRLLPERLAGTVLDRLQEGREAEGNHGKFPAYYRWCRGPTTAQLNRLRRTGFEVEGYLAVFGHGYLSGHPALDRLVESGARNLARRRVAGLTAYAAVTLRRPG